MESFENRLKQLLNEFSMEQDSDTQDYILARYLMRALIAFNEAVLDREAAYGRGKPLSPITLSDHEARNGGF